MNPYKNPQKLAAQIEHVQKTHAAGPIAAAEPLPQKNGVTVQRAILNGATVHLKFDQQPPAGSIPITTTNTKKWLGYLLFIDPAGEIWKVPNIWYNRTWAQRLDELEQAINRNDKKIAGLADERKQVEKSQIRPEDKKWKLRDIDATTRQCEQMIKTIKEQMKLIRKHADLTTCPCLKTIPEQERLPA